MSDSNFEKIVVEDVSFDVKASDGGMFSVDGTKTTTTKKAYHIKKLNSRIWLSRDNKMDLFKTQEQICRSSKDIRLFRGILIHTDREHHFSKSAVEFGKEFDTTRGTVTKFIKKCIGNELLLKIATNKYLVNPYKFTPIGARVELIYKAQLEWSEYEMNNPDKSKFLKPAQELIAKYELTSPLSLLLGNNFFMSVLQYYMDDKKLSEKQIDVLKKLNLMPHEKQGFPGA